MGRPHPCLVQGSQLVLQLVTFRSISTKQTHVILLFLTEIGDTSLSPVRPEMLGDNLLKQLHYVLLEVSQTGQYISFPFSLTKPFVDPRKRRFENLSKLWARPFHF